MRWAIPAGTARRIRPEDVGLVVGARRVVPDALRSWRMLAALAPTRALIDELWSKATFPRTWARAMSDTAEGVVHLRHPKVGDLHL